MNERSGNERGGSARDADARPGNARHAYVRGRVQGVAFRYSARREAQRLGVAGWVCNLADGRVEVWFEGPAAALAAFEAWLAEGPPAARVAALEVERVEPVGAGGFEVRP